MPNYFTLTKKGESEPSRLCDIESDLCNHFNVPVDPEYWYKDWYTTIGLSLACGATWSDMREVYSEELHPVIDYLETHYTPDAWCQR